MFISPHVVRSASLLGEAQEIFDVIPDVLGSFQYGIHVAFFGGLHSALRSVSARKSLENGFHDRILLGQVEEDGVTPQLRYVLGRRNVFQ